MTTEEYDNVGRKSPDMANTALRVHQEPSQAAAQDEEKHPVELATTASKKRPRLDLTDATGDNNRDRKRGKSMFGILLGTLNKAKIEDKERNASEAVCIA